MQAVRVVQLWDLPINVEYVKKKEKQRSARIAINLPVQRAKSLM